MQHWLRDCVRNHRECAKAEQVWPSRLVHVASSVADRLRLLELETEMVELANGQGYATLSHCWGQPTEEDKHRICTTNDNYRHRLQYFDLHKLPKTFQDAVKVARSLGISLLWIDAICIVQSNPEAPDSDWNKEARRMQNVFSSASVTICATSAVHWGHGFCGPILHPKPNPQKSLLERTKTRFHRMCSDLGPSFYSLNDNDFRSSVDGGPLNQRAWVLQESVLSRRLIHFTKSGTYWQCGKHVRTDDFRELRSGRGGAYFLHDPTFPRRLTNSGYYRTIDFLQTLFRNYAQYGLSKASDREIAISGLLERMEDAWDTLCRYGVFAKYIHRLLLWRRQDDASNGRNASHEVQYRISLPSWSWMVCSQIEFFGRYLLVPNDEDLRMNPDPEQHQSLCVLVRAMQGCKQGREGSRVKITDVNNQNVGTCWLDEDCHVDLQHFVVVAVDDYGNLEDSEKIYYILFVKCHSSGDSCKRIGAGTILARCVSTRADAKHLF